MDDADLTAQRAEIEEGMQALARQHTEPKTIVSHCLECGELLPEKRSMQGYHNCVDCQQAREDFHRMHPGARRN